MPNASTLREYWWFHVFSNNDRSESSIQRLELSTSIYTNESIICYLVFWIEAVSMNHTLSFFFSHLDLDSSDCWSGGCSWLLDSFSMGRFLLNNRNNKLRVKSNLISLISFSLSCFLCLAFLDLTSRQLLGTNFLPASKKKLTESNGESSLEVNEPRESSTKT